MLAAIVGKRSSCIASSFDPVVIEGGRYFHRCPDCKKSSGVLVGTSPIGQKFVLFVEGSRQGAYFFCKHCGSRSFLFEEEPHAHY